MRAVICGAGIAGLALARCLSRHGWDVAVLERSAEPRSQGYMIDFSGSGCDAAEAMGVMPRLEQLSYHVQGAGYYDQSGRLRAELSYAQFQRAVGGRILSLTRPDLEQALRESLPSEVDLRYGAALVDVDGGPDAVRVTVADGQMLEADLLVGADGVHSTVRRLVFGDEREYVRYLGFHTAAFMFDDPDVYAKVSGRFCLTDTIDAQMGFYGLRDGRVATFAVHRTPDPRLPTDQRAVLRSEYAGLGWVVPRALAACPPDAELYYDQVAQVEMPRWSSGRTTLVGDACYAVSLLAGQGASLGIAGAFVLAEHLARADTVAEALARYEHVWRPVVTDKQQAARKSARWFLPRSGAEIRIRRAALRLARLPGVDRYVVGLLSGKPTTVVRHLQASSSEATAVQDTRGSQ